MIKLYLFIKSLGDYIKVKTLDPSFTLKVIGLLLLISIVGCYAAIGGFSDDIDPRDVLTPSERKEICYEIYDTPEERAGLLTCLARVNAGS